MMPIIALSVIESELYSAVQCAKDMMFIFHLILSLGLKVELPMVPKIDNKGVCDFINAWSVAGRLRHIENKQCFLREFKEAGLIKFVWRKGDDMTSDIFTKNLSLQTMEKHGKKFYGKDEYHCDRYKESTEAKESAAAAIDVEEDAVQAHEFYKEIFATLIDTS